MRRCRKPTSFRRTGLSERTSRSSCLRTSITSRRRTRLSRRVPLESRPVSCSPSASIQSESSLVTLSIRPTSFRWLKSLGEPGPRRTQFKERLRFMRRSERSPFTYTRNCLVTLETGSKLRSIKRSCTGLQPAGVICEILSDDGTMARVPDLVQFCKKHDLLMITVADLARYRFDRDYEGGLAAIDDMFPVSHRLAQNDLSKVNLINGPYINAELVG